MWVDKRGMLWYNSLIVRDGRLLEVQDMKVQAAVIMLLWAEICGAAIIRVEADGSGDYATIQAAINAAGGGDTIELGAGIYTGNGNRDIDLLGKAVTVRGATGNAEDCVIDCQGSAGTPHRGFVILSGEGAESRIEHLAVKNGYAYDGAGIYCESSSPVIYRCRFCDGTAENWGGGIHIKCASASIVECKLSGNSAFEGAGISTRDDFGYGAAPLIQNCEIWGNTADGSGGGINCDVLTTPVVSGCLIYNNHAGEYGGGGISIFQSDATIRNCTIANNTSANQGGGILQWYYYGNGSTLNGNILWGNSAALGSQIFVSAEMSVSYCDIEWGLGGIEGGGAVSYGAGNMEENPAFVDEANGDYHLSEVSNCVDSGDPEYEYDGTETDIDHEARKMGGRIDIGADEFYNVTPVLELGQYEFAFDANEGGPHPEPQILTIRNAGGGVLQWELMEDCAWLDAAPTSGESSGEANEVVLDVNTTGLAAGMYQCQLVVADSEAMNSPAIVDVSVQVRAPLICASAETITFRATEGSAEPMEQSLSIWNGGVGSVEWQLNFECDWLEVAPSSGSSAGEVDTVTVTADPCGLARGSHMCALEITSEHASNSPKTVQVTMYITGVYTVPEDYATIQAAIDAAVEGDVVVVSPGTYRGSGNRDISFGGKGITVRSVDPDDPAVVAGTVIDCEGTSSEKHRGFRFANSETEAAFLEGLTITNGYGPLESTPGGTISVGGAIYCKQASPRISKCRMVNNAAAEWGSALAGINASASIEGCSVSGNETASSAVYLRSGHSFVRDCEITDNDGRGISLVACSSSLISRCIIANNAGGGISTQWCSNSINISHCLIYYNSASSGAGILSDDDNVSPSIVNCTIVYNTSTNYAGGIDEYGQGSAPAVKNCIIWGNTAANSPQTRGTMTVTYCDVEGGRSGAGNINADPSFYDAGNGDFHLLSAAGRWDISSGSWAMDAVTSPCIDAGDESSDWEDELWPHGKRINMGAFGGTAEASMSLSTGGNIADLNSDNRVDYYDLTGLANMWLCREDLSAEDLDRNGAVNMVDFAMFVKQWRWEGE